LIKLAVERFFTWIDQMDRSGFFIDHSAGMAPIRFFETCVNHTKGSKAGQPFVLAPFQQFTLYNVFGWKDAKTKTRRINTVYDKRAKKNGKTAEMAGLALFAMSFDKEYEAEIYVGATKEDQAKLCTTAAKNMIESAMANPALKALGFETRQKDILFGPTNSFMRPLGGDSKTQDGINAHLAIIDEYHAHASDDVKENLESSMVQRAQPLTWHITTAGFNVSGVCKQYETVCIDVLEGRKIDDHLWIMIHNLDQGDKWDDPATWIKANPLLGQGLKLKALKKEFQKAENQPSKIPNFKTKHLNLWVDAPQIWIPNEVYKKCEIDQIPPGVFQEYGSVGAVDLATTTDITAMVFMSYPDPEGLHYMKPYFFCPRETIERRTKSDRVPYRYWMDKKYLIATEGNTTDFDIVESFATKHYFELNADAFEMDQWNAAQMAQRLMERDVNVSFFSQAIGVISKPTKDFERLIMNGQIRFEYNPIMEWMLSGCIIYKDANENIKVHKGKSNQGVKRVDGVVAAIMCLGGIYSVEESNESRYNDMEIEVDQPQGPPEPEPNYDSKYNHL
jgi:phage terminase large subunit-like protein